MKSYLERVEELNYICGEKEKDLVYKAVEKSKELRK